MGLVFLWIVVGGFLAARLEKEIDREIEAFVKTVPPQFTNDSELKLRSLVKELGIGYNAKLPIGSPYDTYLDHLFDNIISSNANRTSAENNYFERIQDSLEIYLTEQLNKPSDKIDIPPEELQNYLESKADVLKTIQEHVLENPISQWEESINYLLDKNINLFDSGLAFSGLARSRLQRVITLDILDKKRQGRIQDALEMLEVSWRIRKGLHNYHGYYISSIAMA